jgi:hypothetical protein
MWKKPEIRAQYSLSMYRPTTALLDGKIANNTNLLNYLRKASSEKLKIDEHTKKELEEKLFKEKETRLAIL